MTFFKGMPIFFGFVIFNNDDKYHKIAFQIVHIGFNSFLFDNHKAKKNDFEILRTRSMYSLRTCSTHVC